MADAATATWRAVLACGRRLTQASVDAPWNDADRAAVLKALLDRADALVDVEAALRAAMLGWHDASRFRDWVREAEARFASAS